MKRLLIALLAIGLIVIRAALPSARLDEISFGLFGIVCLAILWSDLEKLATIIRRLRVGEFELEMAEKVEKLSEKAEETEEAEARQGLGKSREEIPPDVAKRIAEAGADPRSALLLVAIEIEQAAQRLAEKYRIQDRFPTARLMAHLADRQVISTEVVELFRDFWQVRNQVVHGAGFNVPAGQIYKIVDVGLTILRLLSMDEGGNKSK